MIPVRYALFGKRRVSSQRDTRDVRSWETAKQSEGTGRGGGNKEMLAQNVGWCVIRPHTLYISHILLWPFGWTRAPATNGKRLRQSQSVLTSVDAVMGERETLILRRSHLLLHAVPRWRFIRAHAKRHVIGSLKQPLQLGAPEELSAAFSAAYNKSLCPSINTEKCRW